MVTSLSTKTGPPMYTELHNHLLTKEYLQKRSLVTNIPAPLLLTPSSSSSSFLAQCQSHQFHGQSMGGFYNSLTVVLEVGFSVDRDTTTTTITTIILVRMGSMVVVLPTIISGLIITKPIVSYVMV